MRIVIVSVPLWGSVPFRICQQEKQSIENAPGAISGNSPLMASLMVTDLTTWMRQLKQNKRDCESDRFVKEKIRMECNPTTRHQMRFDPVAVKQQCQLT